MTIDRINFIGGSDVAPILNRSPWRTPLDVYRDKIGEAEPAPDSLLFRVGRELEPLIADIYRDETGLTGSTPDPIIDDEIPFLGASADWLTDNGRLVEFKTLGWFDDSWGESGTDQVPIQYYLQCLHYCHVFKKPEIDLVALERSRLSYRIYTIKYTGAYKTAVIPELVDFWDRVVNRQPPEPSSLADIKILYRDRGLEIEATPEIIDVSKSYLNLKSLAKKTDALADRFKFQLQSYMGDAQRLTVDGSTIHTFKENKNGHRVFK